MDSPDFKARTRAFAIAVVRPVDAASDLGLPGHRRPADQAAAGTAANYRAACRGRSRAEFVAKLGNVLEEADESAFWLDMLVESGEESR